MFRFLFRIVIVLLIGILVYNYFFGSDEEKAKSKEIATKVKDLTASVFDFAKSEKEKFDKGKYDNAIDRLNDVYDELRQNENNMTAYEKAELEKLNREKQALKEDVDEAASKTQKEADKMTKSLDQRLLELVKKVEKQADKIEQK